MLLDLLKLADRTRRGHAPTCACAECLVAGRLIDAGAEGVAVVRKAIAPPPPPGVPAVGADGVPLLRVQLGREVVCIPTAAALRELVRDGLTAEGLELLREVHAAGALPAEHVRILAEWGAAQEARGAEPRVVAEVPGELVSGARVPRAR